MGELDKEDASVIVFTFTKKRGPYVHTACEAWSLCSHSLWNAPLSESGEWLLPCYCVHWQWRLAMQCFCTSQLI